MRVEFLVLIVPTVLWPIKIPEIKISTWGRVKMVGNIILTGGGRKGGEGGITEGKKINKLGLSYGKLKFS